MIWFYQIFRIYSYCISHYSEKYYHGRYNHHQTPVSSLPSYSKVALALPIFFRIGIFVLLYIAVLLFILLHYPPPIDDLFIRTLMDNLKKSLIQEAMESCFQLYLSKLRACIDLFEFFWQFGIPIIITICRIHIDFLSML